MAIWPLLAVVDALDAGRWRRAWLWAAVALTFREDVGLQLAAAALTLAVWPRAPGARAHGAVLAAAGLAWFFGYALLVQPHFLPPHGSYEVHFARFGGGGVGAVLGSALSHPGDLAAHLVSGDRPLYPLVLLLPLALLPLAAPRWLAGALPIVAINLLSEFPGVRKVGAHYVTAAAPFLVAAAICGAARLAGWLRARRPRLRAAPAAALLLASAIAWALRGASPAAPEFRLAHYREDAWTARARAAAAGVPAGASVTAPSPILAHLAARPVAYHPRFAKGPTEVVLEVPAPPP
jgi:hypothetical protein